MAIIYRQILETGRRDRHESRLECLKGLVRRSGVDSATSWDRTESCVGYETHQCVVLGNYQQRAMQGNVERTQSSTIKQMAPLDSTSQLSVRRSMQCSLLIHVHTRTTIKTAERHQLLTRLRSLHNEPPDFLGSSVAVSSHLLVSALLLLFLPLA